MIAHQVHNWFSPVLRGFQNYRQRYSPTANSSAIITTGKSDLFWLSAELDSTKEYLLITLLSLVSEQWRVELRQLAEGIFKGINQEVQLVWPISA